MTSLEFERELRGTGLGHLIENEEVSEPVLFQNDLESIGIVIKNCVFKEDVFFENVDLKYGIHFVNCKFEKALYFKNCRANHYDSIYNYYGYHIEFNNTEAIDLVFENNQIDRGVRIYNKSLIKYLRVESLSSNNGSFSILNSTIETQFDISQGRFFSIDVREDSIVKSKVRFENVSTGSITFTESSFEKDIHIWAGQVGSFTFNDGTFNDDLTVTAVPINENLSIIGAQFKKTFEFAIEDTTNEKIGSLNQVYIKSSKFGEQLIINGTNTPISQFSVDFSKQLEGSIYINSCNILKTKLSGDNYSGNFVLNNCCFNNFEFNLLYNYSTISLISVCSFDEKPEFSVINSNLGKTHFFNINFNTFHQITISNSILTEIIAANIIWFESERLNTNHLPNTFEYAQNKEIYRQLKYTLEKQGDRINSLRFKSLEMKTFKQEQFSKCKSYPRIFNNDRFILWLGQTNGFGLEWWKPALLLVILCLPFYFLIVIGVSEKLEYGLYLNYSSFKCTLKEFWNYIYSFPQILNPIHDIDKIYKKDYSFGFGVYLLDYTLKLFIAFFIYQTISAFRKFMK
jgi:hypothetical protein